MILEATARLILEDHKRRPITGNVLLLGRQTVPFDEIKLLGMLVGAGVPVRKNVGIERDETTMCREPSYVSDRMFFASFSDAYVLALDVSEYEAAEFVHDLCLPVPQHLEDRFDYVFDGSCFDNLFDPAMAMANVARLLRPGGRMFLYNHGTMVPGAFVSCSAEWYSRYLMANAFAEIDVQPYYFDNSDVVNSPWSTSPVWPDHFVVARATKTPASTSNFKPLQGGYESAHRTWRSSVEAKS